MTFLQTYGCFPIILQYCFYFRDKLSTGKIIDKSMLKKTWKNVILKQNIKWVKECTFVTVFASHLYILLISSYRFKDSMPLYHDKRFEGLARVAQLALYTRYPKYATEGFEALYSRPPVIYISAVAPPGLGHYITQQLGLPQSCVSTGECSSHFCILVFFLWSLCLLTDVLLLCHIFNVRIMFNLPIKLNVKHSTETFKQVNSVFLLSTLCLPQCHVTQCLEPAARWMWKF